MVYFIVDGFAFDANDIMEFIQNTSLEELPHIDEYCQPSGTFGICVTDAGKTLVAQTIHDEEMQGISTCRVNRINELIPINAVILDPDSSKKQGYHSIFLGETPFEDYNVFPNPGFTGDSITKQLKRMGEEASSRTSQKTKWRSRAEKKDNVPSERENGVSGRERPNHFKKN